MAKRVLITGMSGLIGGLLKDHLQLAGGYELAALNRRHVEGVASFQADIADLEAIRPAFEGQDVVVHLAANLAVQDWESQHAINVVGTYNIYEAARLAGVRRVVFASSVDTIGGFERVRPYSDILAGRYDQVPAEFSMITHKQVWPQAIYGAAKVWGEVLGRHFVDEYGISIICVRIGSVSRENRPTAYRKNSVYLSHRDVSQALQRCIDAPDTVEYDVVFAVSNNRWNYRDLTHAKNVIGFEPQDSADDCPFEP